MQNATDLHILFILLANRTDFRYNLIKNMQINGDDVMEYAFSIVMFCFSGAILLYAGIMGATKDINMLRRRQRYAAKMNDPKAYAVMVAKILATTALAPLIAGLVGLLSPAAGGIALVVGFAVFIWIGVKRFYYDA